MTKRGLPGPEGSREGRGAEEGHIPWLQSTWPSPGRGRHGEATQAHFPSALRFLGTSIVSGWVRLLCVETTGFGHRQRRLVGAGERGVSHRPLGTRTLPVASRGSPSSPSGTSVSGSPGKTKFSGEQISGRDTSGKVREGTRRHNIDSILPLSFPQSNIPGEGKLEASILKGMKPRSSRLFGEYKLNFSSQPAASARPLCILDRGCPEMQRTGTSHASRVCPCSSALCHHVCPCSSALCHHGEG